MSKKEHILETAEQLFNLYGYTAVGVDWIRDSAGVSKTSMYRHFGGKHKLIEAVLERRHQRFVDSLSAYLQTASSDQEKLHALIEWHLAWFQQPDFHGCMFMHAVAEFKTSETEILGIAKQHKQWLKETVEECLGNTDRQANSYKADAITTLLEGMVVRAEFDQLPQNTGLYQQTISYMATAN